MQEILHSKLVEQILHEIGHNISNKRILFNNQGTIVEISPEGKIHILQY